LRREPDEPRTTVAEAPAVDAPPTSPWWATQSRPAERSSPETDSVADRSPIAPAERRPDDNARPPIGIESRRGTALALADTPTGAVGQASAPLDTLSTRTAGDDHRIGNPTAPTRSLVAFLAESCRVSRAVTIRFVDDVNLDDVDGLVVAVGRRCVLVQLFDSGLTRCGWSVMRLRDLSVVHEADDLVQRVTQLDGPADAPGFEIDLSSFRRAARSIAEAGALAAVHLGPIDPSLVFVGQLRRPSDDDIPVMTVDAGGDWSDGNPTTLSLSAVSHIEVGTPYLRTIARLLAAS
jgi:hypothetical protein